MEANEKKKAKAKRTALLILVLLFIVTLCTIAATLFNTNKWFDKNHTVIVPDNYIHFGGGTGDGTTGTDEPITPPTANVISLYSKNEDDNTAFSVYNMFPGDSVQKNFCVRISYEGALTVHQRVAVSKADEALYKALRVRIVLLNDGTVLYNGALSDIPEKFDTSIYSEKAAVEDIYYQITVSLPTLAGNECQATSASFDLLWWIDDIEAQQLRSASYFSENDFTHVVASASKSVLPLAMVAACLGAACIVLIISIKREEAQ